MLRLRTVLLLAAFTPAMGQAQTWVDEALTERLAWGTANVLLRADSSHGVKVWAVTSRVLQNTPTRDFAAYFDPDSAVMWLAYAEKVITVDSHRHDSASVRLQTPALRATDGSEILLVRRRDGKRWASHSQIYFVGPGGRSPWYIEASKDETHRFLQLLFREAGASHYLPNAPPSPVIEPNPIDIARGPAPLSGNPVPQFPSVLRSGHGGEVWLTFVVQADGTPDPDSFHVLLSDGVEFTRSAVLALSHGRYRPALVGSRPVDARVHQRVTFLVNR